MSIEVRHIQKRFGDFAVLKDISLDFPTGQLTALLGPSGCGKTTLLRVIAGLEQPDFGQVLLAGENASSQHVRERQVGFVFQHYALFKHMTVFDNIAFGIRMKSRRERPDRQAIRNKVGDLLQLVQLDWLADRYPDELSGGQRQRVALARALAVEPRVLLLDEPFGALDAKVRKELRRWLRKLHDELHITSIFVTHDQEEAMEVADQIVLMNEGQVEQTGTPAEVYDRPASPFVFSFLGSVNLFHGRVDRQNVVMSGVSIPHGDNDVDDGAEVFAFARPHDMQIVTDPASDRGLAARVLRVLAFGVCVRVELEAWDGRSPQNFEVELGKTDFDKLKLEPGQRVMLVPSRLKLFDEAKSKHVLERGA